MQRIIIWILITTLLIGCCGCRKKDDEAFSLVSANLENDEEDKQELVESTEHTEYIYVYVCGAVNREGVYKLPSKSRVYEAVEMAGGFREDANKKAVNQAEILEDEEQVYVPIIGEEISIDSKSDGKININRATKEELMTLPGVGESRADSIIKYREQQGAFQSIEDIMQVSGIKEALFEKIKDLITV